MTIEFRDAVRSNVPLLLGLAGGTGSGKTFSALLLARGLAAGSPFAGIDTENGRMLIYADEFPELKHATIEAPFRPSKYTDAIDAADKYLAKLEVPSANRVIVVDSASHEWYGDGGCLDWQEELMRGQESRRLMSWIEPKKAHKHMVTRLLRVNAHVILCFRAEPKVDMIDDPDNAGKKKFVAKRSLTGLDGWIPIAEKNLPYELTASFLCMAENPGVPRAIKLPEKLRPLVPLDKPLATPVGEALGAWAAGSPDAAQVAAETNIVEEEVGPLTNLLLAYGRERGKEDVWDEAITANRTKHAADPRAHVGWLKDQIEKVEQEPVPA